MAEDNLLNEALAAVQARQLPEARRHLMAVVRANPRHEQAWLLLASVVPEVDQAIDCLKRVLALNPNNTRAREWLALAEQKQAGRAPAAPSPPDGSSDDVALTEPGDADRPVPRLGQYLLDYKFVTPEQLTRALREQRQTRQAGQPRRLGDILIEQGAITDERLAFALREQHRSFYALFND
jgi:tetratricopeptide (TPR) repeat protein